VLFFFTGVHADYNTPRDDAETLNYEGAGLIVETVLGVVRQLSRAEERPPFDPQSVERMAAGHGKPRLGILFDPEFEGVGIRVLETLPDTPAARAGLRSGDVLVALGETELLEAGDLIEALEGVPGGEELPLKLRRGGGEEVIGVLFPARRGFRVSFGSVPDYAFSGQGVRFEDIRDGSPAASAGVRGGDVLVRWGDRDVEDVEQWTRLLGKHRPGDLVEIRVMRDDRALDFKVELKGR
jgi:S1-C subfamily serine protease